MLAGLEVSSVDLAHGTSLQVRPDCVRIPSLYPSRASTSEWPRFAPPSSSSNLTVAR